MLLFFSTPMGLAHELRFGLHSAATRRLAGLWIALLVGDTAPAWTARSKWKHTGGGTDLAKR